MVKYLKKLICLLLAVAICLTGVFANTGAFANNEKKDRTKIDESFIFLNYLGIIDGYDKGAFEYSDKVGRAELAEMLLKLRKTSEEPYTEGRYADVEKDYWAANAIEGVSRLGFMNGYGGMFNPNEAVKTEECVKAVLTVLGYDLYVRSTGAGYPYGYMTTGAKVGLLDGVGTSVGENISVEDTAILFFNALEVDLFMQTSYSNMPIEKNDFAVSEGKTLLTECFKIKTVEGVLSGNSVSLLDGKSTLKDGEIIINGETLDAENVDTEGMLGYNVKAYCEEERGASMPIVRFIRKNSAKNSVLNLSADELLRFENRTYYYYRNGGSKESRTVVPTTADIIYNNAYVGGGFSEYVPESGSVTLLDNDGDGKYNVVFINDYKGLLVSSIENTGGKTVFYDNRSTQNSYTLDYDVNCKIYGADGKETEKDAVEKDDYISIAETFDKEAVYIYVSRNSTDVILNKIKTSSDGTLTFYAEDKEYKTVKNFYDKGNPKFSAGDAAVLYFDIFGFVAAAKRGESESVKTAFLIRLGESRGIEKTVRLKMFTQNDKIEILNAAKKVKINGASCDDENIKTTILTDGNVEQLIRYKLNSEGDVKEIFTANTTENALNLVKLDGFSCTWKNTNENLQYKSAGKILGGKIGMNENSIVFVIPNDRTFEKGYMTTDINYFQNDSNYLASGYQFTAKAEATDAVVVYDTNAETTGASNYVMLVSEIFESLNSDGEIVCEIGGFYKGQKVSYPVQNDDVINSVSINEGDVIRISLNRLNEISYILPVFNRESKTMYSGSNPSSSAYNNSTRQLYGKVLSKWGNTIRVTTQEITDNLKVSELDVFNANLYPIFVYDESSRGDKAWRGSADDIVGYESSQIGSNVFIFTVYGVPGTIVIYK